MQRRLAAVGSEATSLAVHPGWTATNLQVHAAPVRLLNPLFAMSPARGALPTLYGACAPEAQPGGFYGPNGMMEWRGYPGPAKVPARAEDRAVAERLWAVSEELTGVSYLS